MRGEWIARITPRGPAESFTLRDDDYPIWSKSRRTMNEQCTKQNTRLSAPQWTAGHLSSQSNAPRARRTLPRRPIHRLPHLIHPWRCAMAAQQPIRAEVSVQPTVAQQVSWALLGSVGCLQLCMETLTVSQGSVASFPSRPGRSDQRATNWHSADVYCECGWSGAVGNNSEGRSGLQSLKAKVWMLE
jgi:hypothetical protein